MICRSKGKDLNGHLIDWRAFTKTALCEVYGPHLFKYSSSGAGSKKLAIDGQFRKALYGMIRVLYFINFIN